MKKAKSIAVVLNDRNKAARPEYHAFEHPEFLKIKEDNMNMVRAQMHMNRLKKGIVERPYVPKKGDFEPIEEKKTEEDNLSQSRKER